MINFIFNMYKTLNSGVTAELKKVVEGTLKT